MVLTLDCTTRLPGTTTAPDNGTSVIQPPATPPTMSSARKPVRNSPSKARAARSTMLSPGSPATSADPSRLARNATPAVRPLRTTPVTERSRGTGPAGLGGANWGASTRGGSRVSSICKTSGRDLGMFMSDGSSGAMIGRAPAVHSPGIVGRSMACRDAHAVRRWRGHELRLARAASAPRRRRLGIENLGLGSERAKPIQHPPHLALFFRPLRLGLARTPRARRPSSFAGRRSGGRWSCRLSSSNACRNRCSSRISAWPCGCRDILIRAARSGGAHLLRRHIFHRHARDQNSS